MTVIAYDGRFVAADRWIVNGHGMTSITHKIEVWESEVLATSGAADHGEALVIWYKDGKKPAAFPVPHAGGNSSEDNGSYLYVFRRGAPVQVFQTWPSPILFDATEFAAGSGGDVARTAMHLGRDAREAAKVANELNIYCGGGVDYIDLDELAITGKCAVRTYGNPSQA